MAIAHTTMRLIEWRKNMARTAPALALLASILSWLDPSAAACALLVVPDQYPTIQSAITAAASGDSILVRTGTYVESLSWSGKDLALLGESRAAEITTQGIAARVLDIGSGVTSASLLEGLTISGGRAEYGGGIRLHDGASTRLRHCRLTGNLVFAPVSSFGGAMFLDAGSSAVIEDCSFENNGARTGERDRVDCAGGPGDGGAIAGWGASVTIRRSTFNYNSADGFGGAVFVLGGVADINSCRFVHNYGCSNGGAVYSTGCLMVGWCTFSGNVSAYGGSAIDIRESCMPGETSWIMWNVFVDNQSGPAIFADGLCRILYNTLAFNDGGIVARGGSVVRNNIVALNQYGICAAPSATIACNDVWRNERYDGRDRNYCGGSDLTGQFDNFSLDPMFCDAPARVLSIAATSPCADKGGPCDQIGALNVDCDMTPTVVALLSAEVEHSRVRLTWFAPEGLSSSATVYRQPEHRDWEDVATVEADASGRILYEDAAVSPGRRYGYRLGVHEGDHDVVVGETWVDLPAAALKVWVPGSHPTRSKLLVSFALPDGEPADLELLDIAGRRVVSRVVKDSGTASQTVDLAEGGELPPGIYWVRLIHRLGTVTAKACVVR